MSKLTIHDLNYQIYTEIFKYLPTKDLYNLCLINKSITKNIRNNDEIWLNQIQEEFGPYHYVKDLNISGFDKYRRINYLMLIIYKTYLKPDRNVNVNKQNIVNTSCMVYRRIKAYSKISKFLVKLDDVMIRILKSKYKSEEHSQLLKRSNEIFFKIKLIIRITFGKHIFNISYFNNNGLNIMINLERVIISKCILMKRIGLIELIVKNLNIIPYFEKLKLSKLSGEEEDEDDYIKLNFWKQYISNHSEKLMTIFLQGKIISVDISFIEYYFRGIDKCEEIDALLKYIKSDNSKMTDELFQLMIEAKNKFDELRKV